MGRGQAAAGDEQVADFLRKQRPVGDVVAGGGILLYPGEGLAVWVVNIDGVGADGHSVLKTGGAQNILRGEGIDAPDMPALPDADGGAGFQQLRGLEAADAGAEETENLVRLGVAVHFRLRQIIGVHRTPVNDPAHVDDRFSGADALEEQHPVQRES